MCFDMDKNMDSIIHALKIVAKIPEGGRLTKGIKNIDIDSYYTSVRRYVVGDSREETMENLRELLQSIDEKYKLIEQSKYLEMDCGVPRYPKEYTDLTEVVESLATEIEASIPGLERLKETYVNDKSTCSTMELLISKFVAQLTRLKQFSRT